MEVSRICERLNVPQATVYRWIKRFSKDGEVERYSGTGRRPSTSERADRRLVRLAKNNRFASSSQLMSFWGESVSPLTVRRRLRSQGIYSRRPLVRPLLSPLHRQTRLNWSMSRCHFRETQWRKIVFTDESRFRLFPTDGRARVWRHRTEGTSEDLCVQTTAYGGGSIHVWGAICHSGKSTLVILRRSVTGETYKAVLLEHLLPWADNLLGDRETEWQLQDDNAPPHRSAVVKAFKAAAGIRSIPWPARSPDLNPIENLWDTLGRRVQQRCPRAASLQQLSTALREEWDAIPQSVIANLITSMTRRIGAVIAAKGGHTKY